MPFTLEPSTFNSTLCVICQTESTEHLSELTAKGIPTLLKSCDARGWKTLEGLLQVPGQHVIHSSCRKRFTRTGTTEVESDSCSRQKSMRSSATFDWKQLCFFCSKPVEQYDENAKARRASTLELRTSILHHCDIRSDDWATEVRGRMESCCDLVAEEAVYHSTCYALFTANRRLNAEGRRGRPEDPDMLRAFEQVCEWLEGSCELLTLDDIQDCMLHFLSEIRPADDKDHVYCKKHLKNKLEERYGQHIYFAEREGRMNVVCFRDLASFIISKEWSEKRNVSDENVHVRCVKSAAKLLVAEIREMKCDMDTYPSVESVDSYDTSFLPPLLQLFLSCIVPNIIKRSALGQCLIQAARPRTMLAPLLLGLAVELGHMYGSSFLVTHLSRLGFCLSYDELTRYKQSVVMSQTPGHADSLPYPLAFTQFVGDNVDHNIQTLDGKGTFHGMGVIAVSIPLEGSFASSCSSITRLKSKVPVSVVVSDRGIPVLPYDRPGRCGLSTVIMKDIQHLRQAVKFTLPEVTHLDTLWHFKWFSKSDSHPRPNWSGYMQTTCTGKHPAAGVVKMLPMVDLKPTDPSCVYSTLCFIVAQAKQLQLPVAVVTFDQPLWMKAIEIAAASGLDVVCRLGGFHVIKSYLGAVGTIMAGSGIEELLGQVYGPDTVVHMLNGNAVSRAVRGHILLQGALVVKLLAKLTAVDPSDGLSDTNEVQSRLVNHTILQNIEQLITDVDAQPVDVADCCRLSAEALTLIEAELEKLQLDLSSNSRTVQLWIRYVDYIRILKHFILAERTGDWHLHLRCIHDMLNVFAASGHNSYFKSCRLYLQLMVDLPCSHPWLYEMFAQRGFHSVRRTDRYWGGLSLDLIIEQCLMKCVKGQGGLTRGRGMTESVRSVWVSTMHQCAAVHLALSTLTGLHFTSQEHVDVTSARATRDCSDMQKLLDWFESHDPFGMPDERLYSLSTGVVASDDVNCDTAEEIGSQINSSVDGVNFYDISLKRRDQVKTIAQLLQPSKNSLQKGDKSGTNLFYRLLIQIERSTDIKSNFSHELTAEPSALFRNSFMRKPNKPAILRKVVKDLQTNDVPNGLTFILDGGALLHHVHWRKGSRFSDVVQQYRNYITRRYGNIPIVIFDGYQGVASTKDHEHSRRSLKIVSCCPDVIFDEDTPVIFEQQAFLGNSSNKDRFIQMLSSHLQREGCKTVQSDDDADIDIVKEALSMAAQQQGPIAVVGEDTDLLVLLAHHWKEDMSDIWFWSEVRKPALNRANLVSIRCLREKLGEAVCRHLLAVHAFGGSDTTSAIFGHGKGTILRKLTAVKACRAPLDTMQNVDATADDVAQAGNRLMVAVYGGKTRDRLDEMRYEVYCTSAASSSAELKSQKLPPTERATYFHSLRAHLQTVVWKYLRTGDLDPLQWGWHLVNGQLSPTMTDLQPAPDDLLKIVRCKCRTTCATMMCSCRKLGHKCFSACEHCHGKSCQNTVTVPTAATENDWDVCTDDLFYDSDVDWLVEETVASTAFEVAEVRVIIKGSVNPVGIRLLRL